MDKNILYGIIIGAIVVSGIVSINLIFSMYDTNQQSDIFDESLLNPISTDSIIEPTVQDDTKDTNDPVQHNQSNVDIQDTLQDVVPSDEKTSTIQDTNVSDVPKIDKSRFRQAPDLTGIAGYINVLQEDLKEEIKDQVVLYDIWTYSCINCIRTLPFITAWDEKYSDQGLLIIGVHTPEFEFEKDIDNVQTAVNKYGIKYPVILDNDKEIWNAFENRYWPRKYIADHEGYIRYNTIGEGKYKETETVIQRLLAERSQQLNIAPMTNIDLVDMDEFKHSQNTPELYFGYKFAYGRNNLGNVQGFQPDQTVQYEIPDKTSMNKFYLTGLWKNTPDSMELLSDSGIVKANYHAKQVNIVTAGTAELEILIDGERIPDHMAGSDVVNGTVMVSEPDLYNIVSSDISETHAIEIHIDNTKDRTNFQIFTFTFG